MAASLVSQVVSEVADLLRHDNLDVRVQDWVSMAWDDMIQRVGGWRFHKATSVIQITTGTYKAALTSDIGDPVLLILYNDSTFSMQTPEYVSLNRFRSLSRNEVIAAAATIRQWTLGPDPWDAAGVSGIGKSNVLIFPATNANIWAQVIYTNPTQVEKTSLTATTELPYHWEHVLIWGASSLGAKFLRPDLYPLYLSEYEQGIRDMQLMLSYWPDSIPQLRNIQGPYAKTPRMMAPPRVPLGQ